MGTAWVGTSGWSYPEWVGRFYPEGTSAARMLAYYASRLTAVEAHSTYRRLPTEAAIRRWLETVPPGFRFAPKAHVGITHRQDLDGVEGRTAAFFAAIAPLGECAGPVLFALPHRQPDLHRLDRLLRSLPPPPRPPVAFQLHPAWSTDEVAGRLRDHGAALAVVDDDTTNGDAGSEATPPLLDAGPFVYVRLRRGRYRPAQLDVWTQRLAAAKEGGRDVYAFFRHEDRADGPRYARRMLGRLQKG